jgi:hypothetical protein
MAPRRARTERDRVQPQRRLLLEFLAGSPAGGVPRRIVTARRARRGYNLGDADRRARNRGQHGQRSDSRRARAARHRATRSRPAGRRQRAAVARSRLDLASRFRPVFTRTPNVLVSAEDTIRWCIAPQSLVVDAVVHAALIDRQGAMVGVRRDAQFVRGENTSAAWTLEGAERDRWTRTNSSSTDLPAFAPVSFSPDRTQVAVRVAQPSPPPDDFRLGVFDTGNGHAVLDPRRLPSRSRQLRLVFSPTAPHPTLPGSARSLGRGGRVHQQLR